jgi:CRP-like cAMP-binding protein
MATHRPSLKRVQRELNREQLDQNAILRGLEEPLVERVLRHAKLSMLDLRFIIYRPEQPIREVYFPLDCVLSVVTRLRDGQQIEIGTVGREGMSAFPLIMGASSTANDSYCQVSGFAIHIESELFREFTAKSYGFRQQLDRYLQAYVNMLGQLAACNRLHTVFERCARWLLLTRDRVDDDRMRLTHEFLAMMLGTTRSGVTIALGHMQRAELIHILHGSIKILNRVGLENAACECYAVAREQFGGLLRTVESKSNVS